MSHDLSGEGGEAAIPWDVVLTAARSPAARRNGLSRIERPTLGWLPTEDEKGQRFEALGIDRAVLPYRTYDEGTQAQKRFFALKFPVAVDAKAATFVYVDPGLTTDSEPRARTFAVQVVAIGTGAAAANRAETVLKSWTRDGDGQGPAEPAQPTQTDPEIQQELARL